MEKDAELAWVESPLQLLSAAEWAAGARRRTPIAGRLTAQMSETADALVARDAWFGRTEPYLGIPWGLLSQHGHWLVGDGFSGQFRLALTALRPRRLTFLDDGDLATSLADSILGSRPYARPHIAERGLSAFLAPLVHEKILRLARHGRVEFFTAFDFGAERIEALSDRGIAVHRHRFEWTRASAKAASGLGPRVVLGSARPVDGRMPLADLIAWVRAIASAHADAPLSYLPHRRETDEQLAAVAAIPCVRVTRTGLPVEIVLAGASDVHDVFTLPSSTTTTLPLVLHGTAARVHTGMDARGIGALS